jgi:DNA-binding MarR family transcriptional regulator
MSTDSALAAARPRPARAGAGAAGRGGKARSRPVSRLEDHLGFWLRFVSNHVSARLAQLLQDEGVSVAEWVVLRSLFGTPGANAGHLVRALGMTKGGVSKILTRLTERGLVARSASDGDRRAQHLLLTPAGEALVPRLAALADANDGAFFGHLTAHQRRELMLLMQKLVRALDLTHVPLD